MEEAEAMYQRALKGYEKAWGLEHKSTLATVNNIAILYKDQGKLREAKEMHRRALKGYEKVWGPEPTSTLGVVNNLGILYYDMAWSVHNPEVESCIAQGLHTTTDRSNSLPVYLLECSR